MNWKKADEPWKGKDMNKTIITFLVLVFISLGAICENRAESPYAVFGDSTPVLDHKDTELFKPWTITISIADSLYAVATIYEDSLTIFDLHGNIIAVQAIKPFEYAAYTSADPLERQTPWASPYAFCGGNPVTYIDPSGCSPIYSETGVLLGTDDNGLQGNYYIMRKADFKQGMSLNDVKKFALSPDLIDSDILKKINSHFSTLPSRPDYDGYLTLDEANDWYRNGNGETLYADLRKINLYGVGPFGKDEINKTISVNLQASPFTLKDGLVYGHIGLKVLPDNYVTADFDTYDFDIKPWSDFSIWIRNVATKIGGIYAGKGTPFDIKFYGAAKLMPKTFIIF